MKVKAARPQNRWFHPKTLLDKTYELGLFVKGIDGAFELLGGLLLLLVPAGTFLRLAQHVTRGELSQDPHDFVATHILHIGQNLSHGHNGFAVAFLLTHGFVKVALVVALLRNKLWAYPWALGILTLFLAYQIYALVVKPGFGMAFLSVLDAIIIWLVWREWHKVRVPAAGKSAS